MNTSHAAMQISQTVHGNLEMAHAIEQWIPGEVEALTQLWDGYFSIADLLPDLIESWRDHDAWHDVSGTQEYVCILPLREGEGLESLRTERIA